tara:strand:- start:45 stop:416 length:372 start_codon:yes stop_codon:yes gene_type:complete
MTSEEATDAYAAISIANPTLETAPHLMSVNPNTVEERTTMKMSNVNNQGFSPACNAVYEGTERTVHAHPANKIMNTSVADAPNVPSKYSAGNPIGRRIHTMAAPATMPIGTSAKQMDSTRLRC